MYDIHHESTLCPRSQAAVFTIYVAYGRSDALSVRKSQPRWYQRSFFPGLTNATLY